ncbi:MAG: DsrE family protein [Acetobacteraceae bacterium]
MHRIRNAVLGGMFGLALLLGGFVPATAANPSMLKTFSFDHPTFVKPHPFATLHVVIQVSENDPARWNLALNNAQNLLDYMGDDPIQIVIVTYGPGLRMILAGSPVAARIAALDDEGVEFDACHNTMENMAKHLGHLPALVSQAVIVPSGVIRILQLEAHGFLYVKP